MNYRISFTIFVGGVQQHDVFDLAADGPVEAVKQGYWQLEANHPLNAAGWQFESLLRIER